MITLDTVTIRFGGLVALDGVSATLTAPVVGIIGPNGAGKTTIMNILSGFLTATSGRVMLDGADLLRLPPHRRARMGLRRSFQREQIADDLTVLDNVLVQTDGTLTPFRARRAAAMDLLSHVGLADRADRLGADLTGFERRLTDVARCMAGTPRLVMFDEPAGGMSVDETLVLDFGRRIAAGPTATVLADPAVKAAYLGVGA
jgi:branched-chain amino acid transport system ATP-binding protein